jgi:acetoacetate decarboxylase
VNREFLIVTYRTDPDALRAVVPEPLQIANMTLGLGSVVHDYLA